MPIIRRWKEGEDWWAEIECAQCKSIKIKKMGNNGRIKAEAHVNQIIEMYLDGYSLSYIQRHLNLDFPMQVYRILLNSGIRIRPAAEQRQLDKEKNNNE